MTLEDGWRDIVTAVCHLAQHTAGVLFTSTDFNSYVTQASPTARNE
jgi:hypothetical protein